jgi:hypothetical protein
MGTKSKRITNKVTKKNLKKKTGKVKVVKSWGFGIEHEMQIFHSGKDNIIFDVQESACMMTGDDGDFPDLSPEEKAKEKLSSACCKKMGDKCYYYPKTDEERDILFSKNRNRLTEKEFDLLVNLDWELTGRQARGCKPSATIVKRVPRLMPELVTGSFRNRTIQSIVAESQDQEATLMSALMRNPFTREKVKKYGKLTTHLCGTLDDIKVPVKPTSLEEDYKFEDAQYKDYVGSYHITVTLPHLSTIKTTEFVKMHQDTANQFQWIEPLLLTAFFTADPESVADGMDKATQGSFRIMNVGWGNLAGSDIRQFSKKGVSRGNTIKSHWRDGLRFKGLHKLQDCVRTAKPPSNYRNALSILTSDFRTFGQVDIGNFYEMEYCRNNYNPGDCPRLDGAPMNPPYGMEIRIFDHFPSKYLIDLMKIIVLLAANAKRHAPQGYVYEDKAWINQLQDIMREGWNAQVSNAYIRALNKNMGLKMKLLGNGETMTAFDLLKKVVRLLHKYNSNSDIVKTMDETPNQAPKLPEINRQCWELSYKSKIGDDIKKAVNKMAKGKWMYLEEFKQLLFRHGNGKVSEKHIGHQIEDILYAMQSLNQAELKLASGSIKQIKLL